MPSVMRSFRGHADQNTTVTVSPFLKVESFETLVLTSPNLNPSGVESITTPGSKLICLSSRSGGCGPASTGIPVTMAVASFVNS